MEQTFTTPEKVGRKSPSSRQSTAADFTRGTTSAQSSKGSNTYSHYRWVILDKARVYVCSTPPPENIRTRIDTVVQRETSETRKQELATIAEQLCYEFIAVLSGARREDDSVEPIHYALSSMDKDQKFEIPRKIDWDVSLKPEVPHFYWSVPFPGRSIESADEPVDSSSKRKQAEDTSSSLERLQSTMPLPPSPLSPSRQVNSILKTPRPNITVGLRHATVVETITAQGVNSVDADNFLKFLQERQTLCSDPSQQSIPIRFPMLVVEGKSYSTGKFVFEAQNQAAVSGSCMLNMQHKLAQLAEPFAAATCEKREPLAFSVCTEGPHMELWVHYTTFTDGMRNYNMNILQTCHASLLDGVVEFLMVVDRVLSWARSEFVEDVAKQLASVECATRQHGT